MQITSRTRLSKAALLVLAGLAAALLWNRPVESQPSKVDSTKWSYTTVTVEAKQLQAKLDELAKGDWEVFSLLRADSAVEQDFNGTTHVIAAKYQVTARKR